MPHRRHSLVESLESRTLLSALPVDWATLSRGVLHLRGTSGGDNFAITSGTEGTLHVTRGEESFDIARDSVRRIVANLGRGHDQFGSGEAIDTWVYGGTGSDGITTGDGNDRVYGGHGDDGNICTSGGNDRIYGGNGNDTVLSGEGADTVYGGSGTDNIEGNEGNDVIYGQDGADKLRGGTGRNSLSGGSGNDRVYSESRRDQIRGGKGTDRFYTRKGTKVADQGRREKQLQLISDYLAVQKRSTTSQSAGTLTVFSSTINITRFNTPGAVLTLGGAVGSGQLTIRPGGFTVVEDHQATTRAVAFNMSLQGLQVGNTIGVRTTPENSVVMAPWMTEGIAAYNASGQAVLEYTVQWPESEPAGSTTFEITSDASYVTFTVLQTGETPTEAA